MSSSASSAPHTSVESHSTSEISSTPSVAESGSSSSSEFKAVADKLSAAAPASESKISKLLGKSDSDSTATAAAAVPPSIAQSCTNGAYSTQFEPAPNVVALSAEAAADANGGGKASRTGGFLHTIKRTFSSTGAAHKQTTDVDFDRAAEDFERMAAATSRVRTQMRQWLQNTFSMLSAADSATSDLVTLLQGDSGSSGMPVGHDAPQHETGGCEDSATAHPWALLAADAQRVNTRLLSCEREGIVASQLTQRCLATLERETALHAALQTRIAARHKMRAELDYYVTKVSGLQKERQEKLEKGKKESVSAANKIERNVLKLSTTSDAFAAYNGALVVEMRTAFRNRTLLAGPLLQEFVLVQRRVASLYNEAMQSVADVDSSAAAAAETRIRADSNAAASEHMRNLPLPARNAECATVVTAADATAAAQASERITVVPRPTEVLHAALEENKASNVANASSIAANTSATATNASVVVDENAGPEGEAKLARAQETKYAEVAPSQPLQSSSQASHSNVQDLVVLAPGRDAMPIEKEATSSIPTAPSAPTKTYSPVHSRRGTVVDPLALLHDPAQQARVESGAGVAVKDAVASIDSKAEKASHQDLASFLSAPAESNSEAQRRNEAVFSR